MAEDLQSLLEKINRDGVEKAQATAEGIISDAKKRALEIVKAAQDEAAKAKVDAEKSAADYSARAAETIRQAARDTVLKVETAVTTLLEKALAKDVDAALSDEKVVGALVAEAVKDVTGDAEIACGEKLVAALKAQLAAKKNLTVVMDATLGTGFSVKTDGGRVEHALTGEVLTEELAKRLRPDLAKLVK